MIFDRLTFYVTLLLVGIGMVMVYSSSAALSQRYYGYSSFFIKRQLLWIVIGFFLLFTMQRLDYHQLSRFVYPVLALIFILAGMVLVPGIGVSVKGARRWLPIGGLSLQPSEGIKLMLILYLSHTFARKKKDIKRFSYTFLPFILVIGLASVLVLLEPDLGNSLVITFICLTLSFIAGVKFIYLIMIGFISLPALYLTVQKYHYMGERINSYLNNLKHPLHGSYQVLQSFYAFGMGGLWGRGLALGRQKVRFLPEPHNDFIFSVIGEELGLIGCLLILVLFVLLIIRGFQIAASSPDNFGRYLAAGITIMIGTQAFVNMAVTVGLLPPKGISLPFISYGGSSLIMSMAAVGILLSVSRRAVPQPSG
ncbi:MAG: putative lipid II flippase FtsW [bacterium]